MIDALTRRGRSENTETHRTARHVKTESEIIAHKPKNKDCWESSETRKKQRKFFSLEPSEGTEPCSHLDFGFLASRTSKKKNF